MNTTICSVVVQNRTIDLAEDDVKNLLLITEKEFDRSFWNSEELLNCDCLDIQIVDREETILCVINLSPNGNEMRQYDAEFDQHLFVVSRSRWLTIFNAWRNSYY